MFGEIFVCWTDVTKNPSNIHKPCKNLGCLFSAFRASCVEQLGVRLPLKAIISCSSRLRGLTAHHKHLTVLLTVFFFRLVPRLLLQLHPPAAKSRPAGIIGPPVHLFLPFTLPESSSSHMHWGMRGDDDTLTQELSVPYTSLFGLSD